MEEGNFRNKNKYMTPNEMLSFWELNKKEISNWLSGSNLKQEKKALYENELMDLEKEFQSKYPEYKKDYDQEILDAERYKSYDDLYKANIESINQSFNMLVEHYLRRIENLKSIIKKS